MTRRKLKENIRFSLLEMVNEIFDKLVATEYRTIDFGRYISFRFKTTSGNEYDLEFHDSEELSSVILDNGLKLGDIIKTDKDIVKSLDIAFTLSNVIDKDNEDEFTRETKLNEHYELMGRLAYIIKDNLENTGNYKLFIVGGDARRNRLSIYKSIFKNNFNDLFDLYYGKSKYHDGESLFIIKKMIF